MQITEPLLSELKTFLSASLQPICEADPAVMAEYVLALLKHDISQQQLREKCLSQLNDFLKEETAAFVEALFAFLAPHSPQLPASKKPEERRRSAASEDEEMLPAAPASQQAKQLPDRSSKRLCRNWEATGACAKGSDCHFVHRSGERQAELPRSARSLVDDESACRLLVDKIPATACHAEAVFHCFKRFGRILQVEPDFANHRAGILFGKHEDAVRAFQSPESMFANRFVKIFWHANQAIPPAVIEREAKRVAALAVPAAQTTKKEALILEQIEAQRQLMQRLSSGNVAEQDRAEILASLEKITALLKQPQQPLPKSRSLDMRSRQLAIRGLPAADARAWLAAFGSIEEILFGEAAGEACSITCRYAERYQAEAAFKALHRMAPPTQVAWL